MPEILGLLSNLGIGLAWKSRAETRIDLSLRQFLYKSEKGTIERISISIKNMIDHREEVRLLGYYNLSTIFFKKILDYNTTKTVVIV